MNVLICMRHIFTGSKRILLNMRTFLHDALRKLVDCLNLQSIELSQVKIKEVLFLHLLHMLGLVGPLDVFSSS